MLSNQIKSNSNVEFQFYSFQLSILFQMLSNQIKTNLNLKCDQIKSSLTEMSHFISNDIKWNQTQILNFNSPPNAIKSNQIQFI